MVTLNSSFSCKQILFNNINNVFKLYTLSKGNYSYWIASNSPCKLISIADYLIEYEGYTQKVLTTEYLPIESNCYCPLAKFRIKQKEAEENVILVKLVNAKE